MINIYAYTYPSAIQKFDGYILTKVGDSIRDVNVRMAEQGGAAEFEAKIKVGSWNKCKKIRRDFDLHKVFRGRGLHVHDGAGTEWFKIPGNTIQDSYRYIDEVINDFEGEKIRPSVKLRSVQKEKLDEAMEIIEQSGEMSDIIANLCPRFGKTIWSLMLFNEVSKKYGNKVMFLPAYWLSVHTSFNDTLDKFKDFDDITLVQNENDYAKAIKSNYRVIIPISLHGEIKAWKKSNKWISDIDNDEIFMFADEGDFGTHADNQIQKLMFLLSVGV